MPKTLYASNSDLAKDKRFTFLSEDVVFAGSTIRVQSIAGFEGVGTSSGQIVMIGNIGSERTELLRTTNTTGYNPSQAYKEITLRDTLKFDHPQDTQVTIIDWNRAEFSWSATAAGTKSTLRAYPLDINPDQLETLYVDTSQTTGFYFVRFNETVGNTNSDYSDPIPYAGYDDNTVFMIKKRALDELNEVVDGQIITNEYLNQCLWQARREYHESPGKRPFRRKYNVSIGSALTGSSRIELPADAERPYSAENLYGVRIGATQNMSYIDKKVWDFYYIDKPHSYLDLPYTRDVSTSIWLANGRDFAQTGSLSVEGMTIEYAKVTGSQNSLTITAHGSYPSASGGSEAWQNVTYGLPNEFTVFADPEGSAYVYFNRPIETAYVNQNIFADYYRTLISYNSDADKLDEPQYDFYVNYLKAKIKHRRNRGETDITKDPDYILWELGKNQALAKEYTGTSIRISPDVNHLRIPY